MDLAVNKKVIYNLLEGIEKFKTISLIFIFQDEMKQYVRFLEMRVTRLEEENQQLTALSERVRVIMCCYTFPPQVKSHLIWTMLLQSV